MSIDDDDFDLTELLESEMSEEPGPLFTDVGEEPVQPIPNVKSETQPKTKVKVIGPRHSTESFWTLVYGAAGTALIHSGSDVPVGRVLQFQAPVAGSRIDEIIAGSWLDKLLQPIVRYQDQAEGAASLLLLPLLVGAYERSPQLATFPMFEQILRKVVETSLLDMAPILKKQQADRKKAARTVADVQGLGADLGLDGEAMKDPVGAIIGGFFYVPEIVPEPESEVPE